MDTHEPESTLYSNLSDWPANALEVQPPAMIRGRLEAFNVSHARLVVAADEASPRVELAYSMAQRNDGPQYPARPAVHFGQRNPTDMDSYEIDARAMLRCILLEWFCRSLNRADGGSPNLGEIVRLADSVRDIFGEMAEAHGDQLIVHGRCQWLEPMRRLIEPDEKPRLLPRTIQRALCVRGRGARIKGSLWVPLSAIELLH